ncbi:hypothetical protein [Agrobacterium fabrum]|nr:hypothetical protein [Agrobacterium fabrum]WLP54085.1 hypothetical protein Q8X45_00760 [Agrobacterium fabrum]
MAIFTAAISSAIAGASISGFFASLGTCPLATNLEEFDMEDYHDRH